MSRYSRGPRNVQIPDGDNEARFSQFDGQRFFIGKGSKTIVDGEPVLTISEEDDRVSFVNRGTAKTTDETATVDVQGDRARIVNSRHAEISAEDTAIEVSGEDARIANFGKISGDVNGVNFANGGESSGRLTNFGTISSDSRAVNIGGDGVQINNFGDIVGTGDQRNGTIYSDGSADNYRIVNQRSGLIDAGEGNQGAGIALQTGTFEGDEVEADIVNRGDVVGRGQAAADTGLAGDGIRIFSGAPDGGSVTFEGNIHNSGTITSESEVGPTAGLRIANGVGFDGTITNTRSGEISGANNGLYFGTGDHDANVRNFGTISSDSRAVNIDGSGVDLNNFGRIVGTGDQRNGTVYADSTADDYSLTNQRSGLIDAGEGNQGAGIALQTGTFEGDEVEADIVNRGDVVGRGQAAADTGLAGDGIRIFSGAPDGGSVTFEGNIHNSGTITSESEVGPTAGLRIANGVGFDGTITNTRSGEISGANNGLYFGTGDHDANVRNFGTISSDSRAVNIDGSGVDLNNFGRIVGTGDQRNGTVYADSTADDYSLTNQRRGLIDAGHGNNGSGVSLQTGEVDGDTVDASLKNAGTIRGRGEATEGNTVGDGVRLFSNQEGVTFDGDIVNTRSGSIEASKDVAAAVGISIEDGISLDGRVINQGRISATETAIDATEAGGRVVIENSGRIQGDVNLSAGDDVFHGSRGRLDGAINAGAGDDRIYAGRDDDVITGGLGNDKIDGGKGSDTAAYDDIDVPVDADLDRGTAVRETGFSVEVAKQPLASLTTNQSPAELIKEAINDNLYFNVHTNDFNGGEIRGQLLLSSDVTEHGVRTIVLNASLDAAQEPGPTSDSAATGEGVVTIVDNGHEVVYSSSLSIEGLATSDLLPVAGVSSIHLHNAPAGVNGPVITDIVQDAGGDVNGNAQSPSADTGDGNVFVEVVETDHLRSIENLTGSNDGDTLAGDAGANVLKGLDGDDTLTGRGGNDTLTGGSGADTFVFTKRSGENNDIVTDFADGQDRFDVSEFGFTSVAEIAVAQDGANTVLAFADNNTATLKNTDATLIDDTDFVF